MNELSKCRKESLDKGKILGVWNTMSAYMRFYQEWVTTCARMNRSVNNPNWRLTSRWNKRGKLK